MVRVGQYFRMSRIEDPLSSEAVLENMHLLTQATVKKILHDPECQEALASADVTQRRYLDLVPAEIVQRYLPKRNPLASAFVKFNRPKQQPKESEELQLAFQDWNKVLLRKLKETFDKGDIKQFYATAEKVLRIKHGNPVVKVVIDDDGELVSNKEEVSKKVAAFFE